MPDQPPRVRFLFGPFDGRAMTWAEIQAASRPMHFARKSGRRVFFAFPTPAEVERCLLGRMTVEQAPALPHVYERVSVSDGFELHHITGPALRQALRGE